MKQLIIAKKQAYVSGKTYADITGITDGMLGIFNLSDGSLISKASDIKSNFAIVCGRGVNKMPVHFPEVDVKTLTVEKSDYDDTTKGKTFTATITIPSSVVKGEEYTIIVAKCGTVFHERNRWTYTAMAKTTTAADVATALVDSINANTQTSGVKATATSAAITITAVEEGPNYNVIGADGLMGVKPTAVTVGKVATNDKAFIQDLASRCAAGKGFNYLGEDGAEIYPGYPEVVDADKYALYTLRFAVPRVAAKQRDEVVYQIVHIAVPSDAGAISTLDAIFGIDSGSNDDEDDEQDKNNASITSL